MFNKLKKNEYVEKFLQLWAIPRWRSLIILCMYFLFFVLVISSINTQDSSYDKPSTTNKNSIVESYKNMDNYYFTITIKNDNIKTLTGMMYDNKMVFELDEIKYSYEDGQLYKKDMEIYKKTDDFELDFEVYKFVPSFIYKLIENGKIEAKTEYKDGTVSNTYLVNVSEFMKLYFGTLKQTNDDIIVTMYQNKDMIFKVDLDLTNVYYQEQDSTNDYKITIEYESVGEIYPMSVNLESSD